MDDSPIKFTKTITTPHNALTIDVMPIDDDYILLLLFIVVVVIIRNRIFGKRGMDRIGKLKKSFVAYR